MLCVKRIRHRRVPCFRVELDALGRVTVIPSEQVRQMPEVLVTPDKEVPIHMGVVRQLNSDNTIDPINVADNPLAKRAGVLIDLHSSDV